MRNKLFILTGFCLMFAVQVQADQLRVLVSNEAALAARFNLIKTAEKEILAEYFEITKDDTSMRGLALLQEAAKRGVKVKLLVDNMHNKLERQDLAVVMNVLNKMEDTKNFEVKVFNPLSSLKLTKLSYRNHDKLMVVDGATMVVGGRNLGDGYFGLSKELNFRDMDVMIKGDSAKVAQNYFNVLWSKNSMVKNPALYEHSEDGLDKGQCVYLEGEAYSCEQRAEVALRQIQQSQSEMKRLLVETEKNGPTIKNTDQVFENSDQVDVQFLFNDPSQVMKKVTNKLADQLYQVIGQNVKQSLTIVTPYLFPTKEAMNLLAELIKNGIKVRIVTNSFASTDTPLVHAAYLTIQKDFARMGAEVFEYAGKDVLHTKVAIIDAGTSNATALIGSFNFDRRSALINREVAVVITGKDRTRVATRMNSALERIIKDSIVSIQNGQIINQDKLEQLLESLGSQVVEAKRAEFERKKDLVHIFPDHI